MRNQWQLVAGFMLLGAILALTSSNYSVSTMAQTPEGSSQPAASPSAKSKNSNSSKPKVLPGITVEREASVMTFVRQHHAELAELLLHLKENSPKDYDRAVRELLRTSERLAQVQERDFERYELELKLWKARSRSQLLAARLQMKDDDSLRAQLRASIENQMKLQLALLERDRDRSQERANELTAQIEKMSGQLDANIDRQLQLLTKATREAAKKTGAPAARKAGTAPQKP